MKVFLDTRMLTASGIGIYIENLMRESLAISEELSYIILGNPNEMEQLILENDFNRREFRVDTAKFIQPIYGLGEQLFGSYISYKHRYATNIWHFPHFNAPWRLPINSIITVHDTIHFLFPRFYSMPRLWLARQVLANAVKKAARIIVISQSTANDLLTMFPGDNIKQKIRVIYQGKSKLFYPLPEKTVNQFKEQHHLGSYILYVGTGKEHKNLGRMIQAYAQLLNDFPALKLVVVGQASGSNEIAIWKQRLGLKSIIEYPWVLQNQLQTFYCGAEALVVPSLYEGFGLPPLEAMACGTPVVVSNNSSLPEVVGEAGIYFNPYDVRKMAEGIGQVLTDKALREELRTKGLQQAERFSWEKTARQTLDVYAEINV